MLRLFNREQFLQQMVLRRLYIHTQKNEFGRFPHTIYKNELKMNLRGKTLKPFEENIEVNVHDLGFGNGVLDMTPKASETKLNFLA